MGLKKWIEKFKTNYLIYIKYPKLYPQSSIYSYVPPAIKIGKNINIKSGVTLSNTIKIIGDFVYIGDRSTLLNLSNIGKYSCISHNVKIGFDNHKLTAISTNPIFYQEDKIFFQNQKPTQIEADVLVSADTVILSGITLGVGCVVGANSFVNKDVPPYTIVAGSPAKIIGYRFEEELIQQLLESKWWEMDYQTIEKYAAHFNNPKEFLNQLQ